MVGKSAFKPRTSTWFGVPIIKYPTDLLVYQQIIFENKPDLIIETGAFMGGSGLFLAHMCDLVGHGEVLSVDISARERPKHPRLEFFIGRSTAHDTMEHVSSRVEGKTVMVCLDSDHRSAHVKRELVRYSKFVTPRQYLIVEDTFYGGLGDAPGPRIATEWFLDRTDKFEVVPKENLFYLSLNPGGYLRRK